MGPIVQSETFSTVTGDVVCFGLQSALYIMISVCNLSCVTVLSVISRRVLGLRTNSEHKSTVTDCSRRVSLRELGPLGCSKRLVKLLFAFRTFLYIITLKGVLNTSHIWSNIPCYYCVWFYFRLGFDLFSFLV